MKGSGASSRCRTSEPTSRYEGARICFFDGQAGELLSLRHRAIYGGADAMPSNSPGRNDEMDEARGDGWRASVRWLITGQICFHGGDEATHRSPWMTLQQLLAVPR